MPELADDADRALIRNALDETILVEAAAGTGKTTELVERIVRTIETGAVQHVREIVAVTFTEKAAGELKLRLREALERARRRAAGSGDEAEPPEAIAGQGKAEVERLDRLDAAVSALEEAEVATIHGFCADLLRERPVEAGVDPLFTVLPEPQAWRLFCEAFEGWLHQQLADPPEGIRRALRRPLSGGRESDEAAGPIDRLRRAAWTLVEWRDFPGPWTRAPFDREREIDRLVAEVARLADMTANPASRADPLYRDTFPARRLVEEIERVEAVWKRDYDRLEASLVELARHQEFHHAHKGRGRDYARGVAREDVWAAHRALLEALAAFERDANADLVARLQQDLQGAVAAYATAKARAGALDFLDLLLRARDLVRDHPEVRRHFQRRFRRLFVDEFQDTDPLQAEILLLLAADDPNVSDWQQVRPTPGKLFIVGDPKQSIYRFRRADVGVYRRVCDQLRAQGARRVTLRTSFRGRPNLQRLVNAAFAPIMTGDEATLQASYVPLEPRRPDPPDQPSVVVLPVPEPYGQRRIAATHVERSLPEAIAAFIEWLRSPDCRWRVAERPRIELAGAGRVPPRAGGFAPGEREHLEEIQAHHIAILFRRFVSYGTDLTRPYVEALEARGIPHLLVGGRSFHEREEIETLRAALAAIEWPDDELSVFAALRGALFAVGDEALLEYRHRYGRFHPFRVPGELAGSDAPADVGSPLAAETGDHRARLRPIADALGLLRTLHRERNRVPVAATIGRLLAATRAHAGLVLGRDGEQALANVLHVAELARQYEVEGGLSFRGFIDFLREQAEEGEASEPPIVEEGSEGVRLMTVHRAKGLEFPVVILADLTAKLRSADASRHLDPARRVAALRLGAWAPHDLIVHATLEVARDEAEGVRLAYVAATRARDLLVIPAVGDAPYPENGWLSPLHTAIYPPADARRVARPAPGCPRFRSKDSVLSRPDGDPASPSTVCPGLHRIGALHGETCVSHEVVWWDPTQLRLGVEPTLGVRRPDLIVKGVPDAVVQAGLTAYHEWRTERDRARASGSEPSRRVLTVRELAQRPGAAERSVEVVEMASLRARPTGARFGMLVHAVLATVPLDADPRAVRDVAALQARVLGAPEDEVAAAAEKVARVLGHELLARAREAARRGACRREAPVVMPDRAAGVLVEGLVDLAFEDEGTWTVIDFKTDQELAPALDVYRRQVSCYARMIEEATGQPARAVLMKV